jgi:hypothetical protein
MGLAADEWWSRRRPIAIPGVPSSAPSMTDLLLHVILHGSRLGGGAHVVWAADAAAIITNAAEALNWDLFIDQVERRRVAGASAVTLTYLADEVGVEVPEHVIHRLRDVPVSSRERLVGRLVASADARPPGRWRTLGELGARYSALTACEGVWSAAYGFPWFVSHWVGAEHPQDLLRLTIGRRR